MPNKRKHGNQRRKDFAGNNTDKTLIDTLPDIYSGILLKQNNQYACLKCRKIFSLSKFASIHYRNCKTPRTKKKQIVSVNDIEWICLECHYKCSQLSDLTTHRRLCWKLHNMSIEYCLHNYAKACLFWCPKCSYSCVSSITITQHSCERRLVHMQSCFVRIQKLTEYDLEHANVLKYECPCNAKFYSYTQYKEHIKNHNSGASVNYRNKIKSIIEHSTVTSSDDVIKNMLQPICNMYPLVPDLNLDLIVPSEKEILLRFVAEKLLAEKSDEFDKTFICGANGYTTRCKSSVSDSNPCSSSSTNSHLNTEKGLLILSQCQCPRQQTLPDGEKKPCLHCLNTFIANDLSDKFNTTNSTNSNPEMSDTSTNTGPLTEPSVILPYKRNFMVSDPQSIKLDIPSSSVNAHHLSSFKPDSPFSAKGSGSNPVLLDLSSNEIETNNFGNNLSITYSSGSRDNLIESSGSNSDSISKEAGHFIEQLQEASVLTSDFTNSTCEVKVNTLIVGSIIINRRPVTVPQYSLAAHAYLVACITSLQKYNQIQDELIISGEFYFDLPLTVQLECTFEKLILCLMKARPYGLEVTFFLNLFPIHIIWLFEPSITYYVFVPKPLDKHVEIPYLCSMCGECLKLSHITNHAFEKHNRMVQEIYILIR